MSHASDPAPPVGDASSVSSTAPAPAPRTWPQFLRERVVFPAIRLTLFYLLVCAGLVYFEDRLIFPGRAASAAQYDEALDVARSFTKRPIEEVNFAAPGGPKLSGWFLDGGPNAPVVLILHGNGSDIVDVTQYMLEAHTICGASALLMDYRGYGRSEGTSTEAGVIADARAGRKWLAERCQVKETDVILWGQSMGGALAIDLAQDGARGLLTEYTFTSLPDAAEKIYFMFPVRRLMKNQMNSLEKIGRVTCPTYIVHGTRDTLVPYEHSERLFAASAAPIKRHFRIDGLGHFTPWVESLWNVRKEFFAAVVGDEAKPATSEPAAAAE